MICNKTQIRASRYTLPRTPQNKNNTNTKTHPINTYQSKFHFHNKQNFSLSSIYTTACYFTTISYFQSFLLCKGRCIYLHAISQLKYLCTGRCIYLHAISQLKYLSKGRPLYILHNLSIYAKAVVYNFEVFLIKFLIMQRPLYIFACYISQLKYLCKGRCI